MNTVICALLQKRMVGAVRSSVMGADDVEIE